MNGWYAPYPEYVEGGIEWGDSLPAEWSHVRLRWAASIYAGGTPSKTNLAFWENGTVPWLNSGSVNQVTIRDVSAFITKAALENSSARWIKRGSLVVALAGQGKTKGMVAQLDIDATCNQSMAAIVPSTKLRPRFLLWWLSSNYQNIRNMAGGDLRDGLNLQLLGDIQCPLPSLEEQTQIAKFLDFETAKIDALIEKQHQLIALLKEKRQAVISRAVTKGLNPDAPMRDSGVEWLGEVPAHWKVRPLKRSIETGSSISYGIVQPGEPLEDGVPFVQTTNMSQGTFDLASLQRTTKQRADAYPRSLLLGGEVLLGIRASIGAAYVVPTHLRGCNLSRGVARISPADDLMAEYLVWYLRSGTVACYWGLSSQGSTFSEVSIETVKELYLAVPSLDEQIAISAHLSQKTSRLDDLEGAAEKQSSLLQERRTALISAAVTGKIDVRGRKAPCEAEVAVA